MFWVILTGGVVGLILLPQMLEAMRVPVLKRCEGFTGHLAQLSQGTTGYRWHGPQDGPVVVCVHGLSTPSFVWDAVAERLAGQGFRVLSYDLYGRGVSDRVAGPQDGAFFARQLNDLLANQGVETPFHLLGYSMGGAVGAYYVAHHPDRVRRAVLIAPAGLGHDLGGFSDFVARVGWLGDWLQAVLGGQKLRSYVAEEALRVRPDVPIIHLRMAEETRSRGFAAAILSSLRNILSGDLSREHQRIGQNGTPLMCVWGEFDDLIPLSGKDRVAELNPAAKQAVIEGCGHEIPYAQADELCRHVLRFLTDGA